MPKTRVVFLDAGTVNWGDQPFSQLRKLGALQLYHSTSPSQVVKRCNHFTHVITNKVRMDKRIIGALQGVRAIHVAATGYNNIDLNAAREKGIAVTNVRGYSTESVVQITFTGLFALASRLPEYEKALKRGEWSRQPFFALTSLPFSEVAGKTLGIIGYGTIGKRVAQIAKVLGMKVLIAQLPGRKYSKYDKKNRVKFKTVLRQSDVVTIHAPLSDLTRNLISVPEFEIMKKTAFLLNMARGGIVDEHALVDALQKFKIKGAASDVATVEPPPKMHVLYNVPRLILTPHIAWASVEARARLMDEVTNNILSFERFCVGSASNRRSRNRLV